MQKTDTLLYTKTANLSRVLHKKIPYDTLYTYFINLFRYYSPINLVLNMENIPSSSPMTQPPTPQNEPTAKSKITTPIIIIIAVIVIGGGYYAYQKWQSQRAINTFLGELGVTETGLFGANIGKIAEEMAKEEAMQAKKTPAEKFATAEIINISDSGHNATANLINNIIKDAYGDAKITGFTSGYMGMNSGSGIIQYMVPRPLEMTDVNALKDQLTNSSFEIITATQQDNSASIMAQKDSASYTFGFNTDDQEIMVIIISM